MVCVLHSRDSATNANLINSSALKSTWFSSNEAVNESSTHVLHDFEAIIIHEGQRHEMLVQTRTRIQYDALSVGESKAAL